MIMKIVNKASVDSKTLRIFRTDNFNNLVFNRFISLLNLKSRSNLQSEVVLSHKEPVFCCLYNSYFKQLVSCTESGVRNSNIICQFL